MTKFKKIIPALCMLLISAVLMGTSTYAWFSMNTTVSATGMQVAAKTDNAFLIISAGTTLSGQATSATGSVNASLKPVKPVVELSSTNIGTVTSWGVASSTSPDDANTTATAVALDARATYGDYVAKQSFMVGIVANSGTVANALKLKTLTISDVNDGITVVVVCGTHVYSHAANVTSGTEELASIAEVTAGVQVDIYIYIDGSNANVKTSNAANLGGTISLDFTIDA